MAMLKRWLEILVPEVAVLVLTLLVLFGLQWIGPEKDKGISVMVTGVFIFVAFLIFIFCEMSVAYWASALVSVVATFAALMLYSAMGSFSYNWSMTLILAFSVVFVVLGFVASLASREYYLPSSQLRLAFLAEAVG
ncbi:MAG: hypothetical protein NTU97_01970, partial [Candidatus Magasanikbacteria bacterium]|nr:hypothetical protein [Candidatus Magasanikbacteria bacterium]